MDVIESSEAFAAQSLGVCRGLELDLARTKPGGGAIALGHPLGASGAINTGKCLYELQRTQKRYGSVEGGSVPVRPTRLLLRNSDGDGFAGKDLVAWIGDLEPHLVHAGLQSNHDDRIFAGMGPGPVPVIDSDMKVAQARGYVDGFVAEYRHDACVLGPVLDDDDPAGERFG